MSVIGILVVIAVIYHLIQRQCTDEFGVEDGMETKTEGINIIY